jgi:hypothetical protein
MMNLRDAVATGTLSDFVRGFYGEPGSGTLR